MNETEGTIRFDYSLGPPRGTLSAAVLAELDAWRTVLRRLELIGCDPNRYDGYGFGNLSVRDSTNAGTFWITATQTGRLERIAAHDVCRVVEWDLGRFFVRAEGTAPPSSEALTHAAIYAADPQVLCVFHVHDPDTWRSAAALALPTIAPTVAYGTVAMADAVAALLSKRRERPLVFATLGHEDGVFSCGQSMDDVGRALVRSLVQALELK